MFTDRLSQKVSVSAIYVLVMFMSIMDVTIVNVALPRLGREFGVPAAHVDTVVVGYLVSLAIFIPVSGWLGDRFGTKRVLLAALVVFTAASALCGAAQSLDQLVLFRVFQGVGGGMLAPVGLAMLFRTFPPAERVRASRILIVPTALAPAIGPVLGGLLVTDISWRWVFYVNLPLGVIGVVFGALFVREQRSDEPGRFDLPGFLLSGIGFGAVMYAASEGPAEGWTSAPILAAGIVGVILLATLVRVELRSAAPMLDLRLLSNRLFRRTSATMVLSIAAFLGSLFLVAVLPGRVRCLGPAVRALDLPRGDRHHGRRADRRPGLSAPRPATTDDRRSAGRCDHAGSHRDRAVHRQPVGDAGAHAADRPVPGAR